MADILADGDIRALINAGAVIGAPTLDQVQPASLDLRLAGPVYRLRASFLPGEKTVEACLSSDLVMHAFDAEGGAALEAGCVYLAPLAEGLANPKSSTGRIDIFVRLVCDGAKAFDAAPQGYHGPLYAEISPRTFSAIVRPGDKLLQARFHEGAPAPLREQVFSLDLTPRADGVVGFRARRHTPMLDLAKVGQHAPADYWEPVHALDGRIILDPGEFYILASREAIAIPLNEAAEMAPIAPELGEFRAHYAGFFDPGFGLGDHPGKAVLEVRSRDVPFVLEQGQPVGKLVFEALKSRPERPYGSVGNHYAGQGLKLSKLFQPWT